MQAVLSIAHRSHYKSSSTRSLQHRMSRVPACHYDLRQRVGQHAGGRANRRAETGGDGLAVRAIDERAAFATVDALPGKIGAGCGQCFRSEEHTSELQSLTNLVCRL